MNTISRRTLSLLEYSLIFPRSTISLVRLAALLIALVLPVGVTYSDAPPRSKPEDIQDGIPVVAGRIEGRFAVGGLGSATYEVKLAVPPGTAGMVPALSLMYGDGGREGFLGPNWSLNGLSSIHRCGQTLSRDGINNPVTFDYGDAYCLDGQRLIAVSGPHGGNGTLYRTEQDSFARIQSFGDLGNGPARFRVEYKNGQTADFGSLAHAHVRQVNGNGVFAWKANVISDRRGNQYHITYHSDIETGEHIPVRIDYTINPEAGLSAYNSVRFEYQPVGKPTTQYLHAANFSTTRHLSRVKMFAGENLAWEYRISYEVNQGTLVERLVGITECSADGACLPSTTFRWRDNRADSPRFAAPITSPFLSESQGFPRDPQLPLLLGDWNGDGKTDIGRASGPSIQLLVSTGNGWQEMDRLDVGPSNHDGAGWDWFPAVSGDFNGDGLSDILRIVTGHGRHGTRLAHVYYSQGNSFSHTPLAVPSGRYAGSKIISSDLTGDGRSDILWPTVQNSGADLRCAFNGYECSVQTVLGFLNCGDGTIECPVIVGDWDGDGIMDVAHNSRNMLQFVRRSDDPYQASVYQPFFDYQNFSNDHGYTSINRHPYLVGDWNADGISDVARVGETVTTFCTSTGRGLTNCVDIPLFTPVQGYSDVINHPVLLGDWNNDGTTDVARVGDSGLEFISLSDQTIVEQATLSDLSAAQGYGPGMPVAAGDWNGDGATDLVRVSSSGITTYYASPVHGDRIVEIADGLNLVTTITYADLTDPSVYNKSSGATYPTVEMQPAIPIVRQVTTSSGASTSTERYSYAGLRGVLGGGGIYGFQRVTTTNVESGIETSVWYHESGEFSGLPRRTENRVSANAEPYYVKVDTWAKRELGSGRTFVYIASSSESHNDLDGSPLSSVTTNSSYDDLGNLVEEVKIWGDGSQQRTENQFANDADTWRIGYLTRVRVTKSTGRADEPDLIRTSQFSYTPDGLLAREEIEPEDNTLRFTTAYEYDLFGNIILTTRSGNEVESRVERVVYDSTGRFAVTSINPLGHTVQREFSPTNGLVTREIDANQQVTAYRYDGFGRASEVLHPDGTHSRTIMRSTREVSKPASTPQGASYYLIIEKSSSPRTLLFYDSMGKELRKVTSGFDGTSVFTDTMYHPNGAVAQISEPYFEGAHPVWTQYQYDVLGRPTLVRAPNGAITRTEYVGLRTQTIDPHGHSTVRYNDGRGRLIRTEDALGGSATYRHDANGDIIEMVDAAGNTISTLYDNRGRKIRVNDPSSGTSYFSYDGFDRLIAHTTAAREVTTYRYDLLDRMVERRTLDRTDLWRYDTAQHGVGKITESRTVSNNATPYLERFSYDQFGRVIQLEKRISGRMYTTTHSYDHLGRLDTKSYPSGFSIRHVYNPQGYLHRIERARDHFMYWSADLVNPRGQIEQQTLGNGTDVQYSFEAMSGLPTEIQASRNSTLQISAFYRYDETGNLVRRGENLLGTAEQFHYDGLNRLIVAHVESGSAAPVRIQYDHIGNITHRSDVGDYIYGEHGAGPYAVTEVRGTRNNRYEYDRAGRRVRSSDGSMSYSAGGATTKIQRGDITIEFELDSNDRRISERTYHRGQLVERKDRVDDLYERVETATSISDVHMIRAISGDIAIYTEKTARSQLDPDFKSSNTGGITTTHKGGTVEKTLYVVSDHLGSPQALLDERGVVTERLSFDSWGNRRDPHTWQPSAVALGSQIDRGFTGHDQLDSVHLIHMNGRIYDPLIGRFTSPDPVIQSPENPQNLNRYSYVLNNPLSATDPSGFFFRRLFRGLRNLLHRALPIAALVVSIATLQPQVTALLAKYTVLNCISVGPGIISSISGASVAGASTMVTSIIAGHGFSDSARAGLRAAPFGALNGFAKFQVGEAFWGTEGPLESTLGRAQALTAAHALTGGGLSMVRGGKFLSGLISELATSMSNKISIFDSVFDAALAGGTGTALAGGRFEDGVMAGAFQHLYNEKAHGSSRTARGSTGIRAKIDDLGRWVTNNSEKLQSMQDASLLVGIVLLPFPLTTPIGAALIGASGTFGTINYIGSASENTTGDAAMAILSTTMDAGTQVMGERFKFSTLEKAILSLHYVNAPEYGYQYLKPRDGSCSQQGSNCH